MATLSQNRDVDYIAKDFNSTVDALINFATVNYGSNTSANRLWTSFNADSFSRNWLEILAYVADLFFFYFDQQATETYLQTARVRSSVELIAKQFGFTPGSATSSSGVATFTTTGTGTIPRGFKVQASNGAQFYTTVATTVIAAGTVNIPVLQGIIVTEIFAAQGLQTEQLDLKGPNVIRDLKNISPSDVSPIITVNGNNYTLVDSFIRNNGEDTPAIFDSLGNVIGGGGRVYTLSERSDGTPYITFGDGIFGRKLQAGETVSITYRTGGGSVGNIPAQTLNTLIDTLPFVASVINNADFSGGADEQTIDQLRQLIPASLRTLDRAVTTQDYADILEANFTEVFTASAEANLTQPGIDLNIYVVPQGSGITKISDNILLKNKLSSFVDRRKMVTTQFQILDAYGINVLLGLEIFISDTASKTTITEAIQTALTNYFNLSTGGPSNSGISFAENILLKDINNIIEGISGIDRFEITKLTYVPRIDESIVGLITNYNSSTINVFPSVSESEWAIVASGPVTRSSGDLLLSNTGLVGFSYTSSTGLLSYTFPVNLDEVSPGDLFRDGSNTDYTILAVDTINNTINLTTGLTINNTVTTSDHGSIRSGGTSYESFKCFKKLLAEATNLSVDSITDTNLDLSVLKSTGVGITSRILLDNSKVFIPNQYATGDYYLVDSAGHIWQIQSNDSNTIKTSISAVDDASITTVASGDYKIVANYTGKEIVFQDNIFTVQFNSENTFYSIGAQFSQIGTIGDAFAISTLQNNKGNLGIALDLINYNSSTGVIRLNGAPSLKGVNSNYSLIDKSGQTFNVVAVDDEPKPSVFYDSVNLDSNIVLTGSGLGSQLAQGFKVPSTDTYAIVSWYLKKEGNIVGNLTALLVNDDGTGLPDTSSIVASSNPISISTISDTAYTKTIFNFTSPPTLTSGTQYHIVLVPDAGYVGAEQNNIVVFDNTSLVTYTYNSVSGVVQYASSVNLSNIVPGNYLKDNGGNLWKILAVDDTNDTVTLDVSLSVSSGIPSSSDQGSILANDRVTAGVDSSSPSYSDGKFSKFDGSLWSNDTQGPSPSGIDQDAIFSVEGTKSITVQSNLAPILGAGATVSTRYYDNNNELSLILGISSGTITSASDANPLGKGTVASVSNRPVDFFVFRSSRYTDDIVNLRLNEIPELETSNIEIKIFGGID